MTPEERRAAALRCAVEMAKVVIAAWSEAGGSHIRIDIDRDAERFDAWISTGQWPAEDVESRPHSQAEERFRPLDGDDFGGKGR